ncbi:MAG TPA: PH domain-containing protein [Candidatus Binataceae bacterium]|nr:PH domain-containing protein [Candidatus Binataceae bacterium]
MRCLQCGFEAVQGATFCSRCGERLSAPRPAMQREYALTRIMPSWWHYTRQLVLVILLTAAGLYLLMATRGQLALGFALIALALLLLALVTMARRYTSWSLTSDRLIERRGWLASHRREMELADVRSIEVDRSLSQRMLGLGNVMIASAASADFMIRLWDVPDPERVAEILRQARLKRLA